MNTSMKKTLLASLVVPFALGAQSASAVQITEWGYDVDSSLSLVAESGGNGSVTSSNGGNTLSWGSASPQSSISIEDVSSSDGGLFTNGSAVLGGAFTHNNRVIAANDSALTQFNLTSSLVLTPVAPEAGDPRAVPPLTFASFFSETLNMAGSCVGASTGIPCDDIFTIGNISEFAEETDFGFQIASQSFTIDDFSYTVFLELEGLTTLENDACGQAGAPDGCVGLLTQENALNSFDTRFRIVSQQVPEPGTLALLGMGLAGLGLSRRKARK